MEVVPFSVAHSAKVRSFVLYVLYNEGFGYDLKKDNDLDDIYGSYCGLGGAFFVLFDGDSIIGTCAVKPLGNGVCEIRRLYVRKNFRGKGLGLTLLKSAMDFAGQNYLCAKLKTDPTLTKAISLYLANGFILLEYSQHILYFEKHF